LIGARSIENQWTGLIEDRLERRKLENQRSGPRKELRGDLYLEKFSAGVDGFYYVIA
jgi:hypothetical protein